MAQDTPQAINIPSFLTAGDNLAAISQARKLDVDEQGLIDGDAFPALIGGAGKGPYKIPQDPTRVIGKRTIQNVGTDPILVRVGSPVSGDVLTAANFQFILAGGNADNDGLGSQVDLSNVNGVVSLLTQTGTIRAALFQAYTPDLRGRNAPVPSYMAPAG